VESPAPAPFAELGAASFFIDKLALRGVREPTEIQRRVIPPLLAGRNLLFSSATGTGKTFAYLLPFLQRLLEDAAAPANGGGAGGGSGGGVGGGVGGSWPELLVCAPTYELCSQIKGEADFLLQGSPLKAALLIGSVPLGRQIEALKKSRPAVVAGNPGRLLVLARMGKLKLRRLRFLVLDEGDRLVSEELYAETRELAGLLNPRRVSAACSATLPPASRDRLLPLLGERVLSEESAGGEVYRRDIEHWALFSEGRRKIKTLRSFIAAARPKKALVFTARGGEAGNILSQLQHHKIAAAGLYGDMDKKNRKAALDDFRAGRTQVLVSSDLAARGLDIPGVSHVIALDVPAEGGAYLHRAGRTGRAGKRGVMVTIGDAEELPRLAAIEKKLGITVYPKELYRGGIGAPEEEPE
jgi:superfamily II DNA/RNA helicase